jgi:hypothetical protein
MECSAQEPNILLVVAYRKDGHAAGSETHLLMRRTYNKGLTNPEYKSTPQDLTEEKVEKTQECKHKGIKVRFQQESKFFCIKPTNSESLRLMF